MYGSQTIYPNQIDILLSHKVMIFISVFTKVNCLYYYVFTQRNNLELNHFLGRLGSFAQARSNFASFFPRVGIPSMNSIMTSVTIDGST